MSVARGVSRRAGRGRSGRVVGVLGAVVVLAAGTLAATSTPAGAVGSWTTPVDISAGAEADPWPRLAGSDDGARLTAVWVGWPVVDGVVFAASSSDGGVVWSPPVAVSSDGQTAVDPQVAASGDGTRVVAVWQRADGAAVRVQAARSTDGGVSWSTPVNVSSPGGDATHPQIVTSDDGLRAAVVWQRYDVANGLQVQAAASSDGGATWSLPTTVSASPITQANQEPKLVASRDGTRLTVVWHRTDGPSGPLSTILAAASSNHGETWSPPRTVSVPGHSVGWPVIAGSADGTRVTTVWEDSSDVSSWGIQSATSSDGGDTWSATRTVSTCPVSAGGRAAHAAPGDIIDPIVPDCDWPEVAASGDGTRLTTVWHERYSATGWRARAATSVTGGTTWGPPLTLSTGTTNALHPQVVTSGDGLRVAVVWWNRLGSTGFNDNLQATTSSTGGVGWTTPVDLFAATGTPASLGQLVSSVDGTRLAVVWVHGVVQVATGGNGGPGVVGVWPVSGPDAGGTVVSLSGTGLTGASGVVCGGWGGVVGDGGVRHAG